MLEKRWMVLFLALICTGCGHTNLFAKNYFGADGKPRTLAPLTDAQKNAPLPEFRRGKNLRAEDIGMRRDGYAMVGSSHFDAVDYFHEIQDAPETARAVDATVVYVYSRELARFHTQVVSKQFIGVEADDTQPGETEYRTVCNDETLTCQSEAAGTTPATRAVYATTVENVDHEKEAFLGIFWKKAPKDPIGVVVATLLPKGIAKYGARGVLIRLLVNDSPAAAAGLREHDVIVAIGDEPIVDFEGYVKVGRQHLDQQTTFSIVRNREKLIIPVKIGPLAKTN